MAYHHPRREGHGLKEGHAKSCKASPGNVAVLQDAANKEKELV
jgi:hypothetical protein